jgi:hypothetical protein
MNEDTYSYFPHLGLQSSFLIFALGQSQPLDIHVEGLRMCVPHITDIAVGAPYDGPEGRGAVYIFHGSDKGIMEKPSQVIQAENVHSTLSTFGFSVAGGMDLDENEYPDLVVGAYEADTAVFLRYWFGVDSNILAICIIKQTRLNPKM